MKKLLKALLAISVLSVTAAVAQGVLPNPKFLPTWDNRGNLSRYLELTGYGVVSGGNANAALQAALNDCGTTGKPVHVAAGTYLITATSNWPTANNNCPGIFGDGPNSIFVPVDFNGAVITATIQTGIPQLNKTVRDIGIQAQWTSATPTYNNSRLLHVVGASDGWAYSRFERLRGYAVHDIIRFATPTISAAGLNQSNSGWNYFDGFFGTAGSQGIYPDSYINYNDSTSTGNIYSNFVGSAATAWIYAGGGAGVMVGDMVVNGGHLAGGRVLYIAGGATCAGYERTIDINNVQVDANGIEVAKAECGFINNLKINGSVGGTAPWAGLNYVSLSDVHDLGEGHWGAGGSIQVGGSTGTHTAIPLWVVRLGAPSNQGAAAGYTMSRIEVSVTGVVGGVGGGGVIATYDCAVSNASASCTNIAALSTSMIGSGGAPPAGWPVINTPSITGNVVTFTATWTDSTVSTIVSNIKANHGALKINRGSGAGGGVVP